MSADNDAARKFKAVEGGGRSGGGGSPDAEVKAVLADDQNDRDILDCAGFGGALGNSDSLAILLSGYW